MKRGLTTVEALRARCTIDPVSGCWLWQGACSTDGLPRIHTLDYMRLDKRVMSGPLAAWQIAHGEAPPNWAKFVFRGCGHSLCLNPVHLRLARDKAEIGQHWRIAGYRKGNSTEARRANIRLAHLASGKVPTAEPIVLAIRAAAATTTSTELAALHGMAVQTVSRIRRGESHRHLLPQEGATC